MGWIVNAEDWVKQAFEPIHDGKYPSQLRPEGVSAVSMSLNLSTAGRLGFFIDYSERETVGDHTFYVARTHGTQGTVGCTWTAYDSADGAELATGVLYWRDQSADIKEFTVNVSTKPAGDHRIYVLLSDATGGAVLHHGEHTTAYGIIDDGTIATSNAIFIDADAVTDGDGSQGNPFNNWYSARDAVTVTTRFVYIKGLLVPDATDNNMAGDTVKHLAIKESFSGRTSESQRIVIRSWPSFTGGVDGGGQTDVAGFGIDGAILPSDVKYITLRKLSGTNLDNTSGGTVNGKGFFLRTRQLDFITTELITINNVISGANAAAALWFVETGENLKIWRWNTSNASHASVSHLLNTFECYGAENVSIQRCTIERTAGGIYQKSGVADRQAVGLSCRFNILKGGTVRLSTLTERWIQSFHIVQNNIFDTPFEIHDYPPIALDAGSTNEVSEKNLFSNNVFYNYSFSTYGDISSLHQGFDGVIMYNNIHAKTGRPWRFNADSLPAEYIDYNAYSVDSGAPVFDYLGNWGVPLQDIRDLTTFEDNSLLSAPLFTDAATGDFTLSPASPSLTSGVSGTPQGAYLAGFINIGAN